MKIPVIVEPVNGNGYRASGGSPFALTAYGPTREAALQNLRASIKERMQQGAEVVSLDMPEFNHPSLLLTGIFDENDPHVQEWKQIMAENRRKADEEPDFPWMEQEDSSRANPVMEE